MSTNVCCMFSGDGDNQGWQAAVYSRNKEGRGEFLCIQATKNWSKCRCIAPFTHPMELTHQPARETSSPTSPGKQRVCFNTIFLRAWSVPSSRFRPTTVWQKPGHKPTKEQPSQNEDKALGGFDGRQAVLTTAWASHAIYKQRHKSMQSIWAAERKKISTHLSHSDIRFESKCWQHFLSMATAGLIQTRVYVHQDVGSLSVP